MEQLIIKALKSACGNKNLKFQVVIHDRQLYIYANHRQNYHPQYVVLESNVGEAIASLDLETIDSIWLYARPLGQTEPNWQVYLELPTQVSGSQERDTDAGQQPEPVDPLDDLPNLDSLIEAEEKGDYDPTMFNSIGDTDKIHKDLVSQQAVETFTTEDEFDLTGFVNFDNPDSDNLDSDRVEDTGLLQNTGFVHGSPLKEAELDMLSVNFDLDRVTADFSLEANTLAQYCFVTNEKLLIETAPPPEKEIMRMVKFVHYLSVSDRQQLLSILDGYFRLGVTSGVEKTLPAIQTWIEKLKELDEGDRHLLAVWLSRYCFRPEVTLEEFKTISAAQTAESNNKKSTRTSSDTEYGFVPLDRPSFFDYSTTEEIELDEAKFQLPPIVKKILLPGIWILTTVVLILLSTLSHNAHVVVASAQIPAVCSNTIGSPEYCRLAANLAGEKTLAQAPVSLFPLTEVTKTVAEYGCGRYANLKAGIDVVKIPPATTPVLATQGEQVFPHVYVIQVEQKHTQQPGNIKVGCVYTAGNGQRSPKKLAADLIPLNWPTEHYRQSEASNKMSFGMYSKPIMLGLYTIVAALGIFCVSWLNLGLKINHTYTIYLVALLSGMVQLIIYLLPASFSPAWRLFGAIAVQIMMILLASLLLKDFRLDWKRGYFYVAASVLAIVAIQFLFQFLVIV